MAHAQAAPRALGLAQPLAVGAGEVMRPQTRRLAGMGAGEPSLSSHERGAHNLMTQLHWICLGQVNKAVSMPRGAAQPHLSPFVFLAAAWPGGACGMHRTVHLPAAWAPGKWPRHGLLCRGAACGQHREQVDAQELRDHHKERDMSGGMSCPTVHTSSLLRKMWVTKSVAGVGMSCRS